MPEKNARKIKFVNKKTGEETEYGVKLKKPDVFKLVSPAFICRADEKNYDWFITLNHPIKGWAIDYPRKKWRNGKYDTPNKIDYSTIKEWSAVTRKKIIVEAHDKGEDISVQDIFYLLTNDTIDIHSDNISIYARAVDNTVAYNEHQYWGNPATSMGDEPNRIFALHKPGRIKNLIVATDTSLPELKNAFSWMGTNDRYIKKIPGYINDENRKYLPVMSFIIKPLIELDENNISKAGCPFITARYGLLFEMIFSKETPDEYSSPHNGQETLYIIFRYKKIKLT